MKKKLYRSTVRVPSGNGSLMPAAALTKQASYTWNGDNLLNRVYAALKALWNTAEGFEPIVRVNGVYSGCAVIADGVSDNVQVGVGVGHLAGLAVTVAGDTTVAMTRPASGKVNVIAIHGDSTGTIATTVGTDGDTLDLVGGYGGAGQKPLVAVDKFVIGYVPLTSHTSGAIDQAVILPGENANVSFIIDDILGLVILSQALELNHTGGVPRGVYAQYYTQADCLAPIGELVKAELEVTNETIDTTVLADDWKDYDEGLKSWKVSAEKFKENQYFMQRVLGRDLSKLFVELKEKPTDTFHYLGKGLLTGYKLGMARGPVKEPVNFIGCGPLREVTE